MYLPPSLIIHSTRFPPSQNSMLTGGEVSQTPVRQQVSTPGNLKICPDGGECFDCVMQASAICCPNQGPYWGPCLGKSKDAQETAVSFSLVLKGLQCQASMCEGRWQGQEIAQCKFTRTQGKDSWWPGGNSLCQPWECTFQMPDCWRWSWPGPVCGHWGPSLSLLRTLFPRAIPGPIIEPLGFWGTPPPGNGRTPLICHRGENFLMALRSS